VATAPPVETAEAVAIPVGPVEAGDEPPAPTDAVPIQSAPETGAGTIAIGFGEEIALDRLLGAIESLTETIRGHPGPLPVVISIPVAGATRQVRLPHRAEWDDRLAEQLSRAAGFALAVELRAPVEP
jgi:hypothetical protein